LDAGYRCDLNDRATSRLEHRLCPDLRAVEDGVEIKTQDFRPPLRSQADHGCHEVRTPRVVDEDVELAKVRDGSIEHRLDGLSIAYVRWKHESAPSQGIDLLGESLEIGLGPCRHRNVRTGLREPERNRSSDPARCPRDDRDLVL
jgi:hypothetical protein